MKKLIICITAVITLASCQQPAGDYNKQIDEKSKSKDFKGALELSENMIKQHPGFVDAYYDRIIFKEKLKDYTGVVQNEEQFLEFTPDQMLKKLGTKKQIDSLSGLQDLVKLYIAEDKLRMLFPGDTTTVNDNAAAIKAFARIIAAQPKHAENYIIRGNYKTDVLINDFKGAVEDYNKAIELDPKNGLYYRIRGNAKMQVPDTTGGCADYHFATKLGDTIARVLMVKICN